MKRRLGFLAGFAGLAGLAYACGGTTSGDDGGGPDSTADTTVTDAGNKDTGGGSDTGGGGSDAACDACATFTTSCADAGCPTDQVCVAHNQGPKTVHDCYPLPSCGCPGGSTLCQCIGACACPGPGGSCVDTDAGGINCGGGPISRREYKADVAYLGEAERQELAEQALTTHLAEYRYKTEPEGVQRHLGFIIDDMPPESPAVESDKTHVDLYGYTSMLLATVQEQQKQIDELKKQVDALTRARK